MAAQMGRGRILDGVLDQLRTECSQPLGEKRMSWYPPSVDTTHAMYQPQKRAARVPLRVRVPPEIDPRASGSIADREAWMRERQTAAKINASMESALLAEAYQHLAMRRRTRIKE
jgi:hypothetical protein